MFDLLESSIRKPSHKAEYIFCKENVQNYKWNSKYATNQTLLK